MEENAAGDFPYVCRVPVRIRDIDFAGHAHHSAALLYFEEARAGFWRDVVGEGEDVSGFGFVLGSVAVRYRARVLYPDTLSVGVRATEVGRKHFVLAYEVRSESGDVLVTGSTVQVMYDYGEQRSVPIPDPIRRALAGPAGAAGSDSPAAS